MSPQREDGPDRMQINPVHLSIGTLLGSAMTFEVPRFQRNFAWGAEEVHAFLRDLARCLEARAKGEPRDHFFGGMVTARAPVQGSTRQNLQVIDGQQRLATFLMLVVQLKHVMIELSNEIDPRGEEASASYLKERAQVLSDRYEAYRDSMHLKVVSVPRLTLSMPDQAYLGELFQRKDPDPQRNSHILLENAFTKIGDYLKEIVSTAEDNTSKVRTLDLVHEILEQDWTVIHMAAESRTNAYMLFQVLNDRGASLTEGELLRAATLEALEPVASAAEMKTVEDSWDDILSGDAIDIRAALQWVYASQMGELPGKATLLDEFEAALFPKLRESGPLEREDVDTLLETIGALRSDFGKLEYVAQGDWPCADHHGVIAWDRDRLRLLIDHLKQTDCIPLLLAATLLTPPMFSNVVQVLERFCFRYTIVVEGLRTAAVGILNKNALEIRRNPSAYRVGALIRDLRGLLDLHAPEEVFRSRLEALSYPRSASKKPLKYLLMTLEHYLSWYNEGAQGTPVCRDRLRVFDFDNGSIEHIYPENAEQPDPLLDPLLDNLGNLTFLSPSENDAAGAKRFEDKKRYLSRSTSMLNQEVAKEVDWTAEVIRRRQERLVDVALHVFSV